MRHGVQHYSSPSYRPMTALPRGRPGYATFRPAPYNNFESFVMNLTSVIAGFGLRAGELCKTTL